MQQHGKISVLFRIGDAVFLIAVGAESGIVMQWVHQLGWNFLALSVLGMAAAMAIQMLLSFGLSPLLGSIETMAPSMVVAMIGPMLIDAGDLMGLMMRRHEAAFVGGAFGLLFFSYLEWYGARIRSRLAPARQPGVNGR
ncbi:MAG: hypothetical protein AMXMBFR20_31420 [Planctomycetia bacterium]